MFPRVRIFFVKKRRWVCHRLFDLIIELYFDLIIGLYFDLIIELYFDLIIELYFDLVLRFILLGCCFCTLPVLRAVWRGLSVWRESLRNQMCKQKYIRYWKFVT